MAKYNRILVAVDGSETSLHALQESFKLTGSWVTVVAWPLFMKAICGWWARPSPGP